MAKDPQELLLAANAALQKGDREQGALLLEQSLALQPNNPAALNLKARVLMVEGKLDDALRLAQQAVSHQSLLPYVVTLAEITKAKGNLQEAAGYYSKILAAAPNEVRALLGMGEIYEQSGYTEHAIASYRKALDQDEKNVEAAVKFSRLLPIPRLPEGLAALDKARPSKDVHDKQRLGFLDHYVAYKEWAERVRHNQLPYHSVSLNEAFFHYASAEHQEFESIADRLLKQTPDYKAAILTKASCLFTRDKRLEAQPYYEKVAQFKRDAIYDNIDFQPSFYRGLAKMSDDDLLVGVPPLIDVLKQEFTEKPIIYLSCNYDYYVGFARAMLLSIDAVSEDAQVHLHLMDASDEQLSLVKSFCAALKNSSIAISAERPDAIARGVMPARCYYHAIRFIRLYNHLKAYNRPLWLMDVDALLNRDPSQLFSVIGDADLAFRARPGRWEPWNQHNASVIGLRPTERSFEYLHLIAAYISHFYKLDRLRWGIDQLAMYGVHEYLRDEGRPPSVRLLNDRAVDYEANDDGFVWCNSGKTKFLQLENISKGKEQVRDPSKMKYYTAFKKYSDMLR